MVAHTTIVARFIYRVTRGPAFVEHAAHLVEIAAELHLDGRIRLCIYTARSRMPSARTGKAGARHRRLGDGRRVGRERRAKPAAGIRRNRPVADWRRRLGTPAS
jgi:hypothetical protein